MPLPAGRSRRGWGNHGGASPSGCGRRAPRESDPRVEPTGVASAPEPVRKRSPNTSANSPAGATSTTPAMIDDWITPRRGMIGRPKNRTGRPSRVMPACGPSSVAGAELAVARVAQAGQDVPLFVELSVERRAVHLHVRVRVRDRVHALGRSDEVDELDAAGPPVLQHLDGGRGRATRGEHRVEDEAEGHGRRVGQLVVVLDRPQRALVAEEPEVPDLGGGHQLEHGVHHAQPGTQDGDEPDAVGQLGAGGRLEGRFDADGLRASIGQRLVPEQPADLAHQLAELLGLRGRVAQQRQLVRDGGVRADVERGRDGSGGSRRDRDGIGHGARSLGAWLGPWPSLAGPFGAPSVQSIRRGVARLYAVLRVAGSGTGVVGPFHVDAVRRGGYGEVTLIAGSDAGRAAERARALGVHRSTANVADVFGDPAIDVVHVCTPNVSHVDLTERALAAGKHVVVEKTLAMDLHPAHRSLRAARASGRHAMVAFTYRGYPMVRRARAIVAAGAGELGALRLARGQYIQDWLSDPGAYNWRGDPAIGGTSRAGGGIGSPRVGPARVRGGGRGGGGVRGARPLF